MTDIDLTQSVWREKVVNGELKIVAGDTEIATINKNLSEQQRNQVAAFIKSAPFALRLLEKVNKTLKSSCRYDGASLRELESWLFEGEDDTLESDFLWICDQMARYIYSGITLFGIPDEIPD